jgi:hypothetical protein
VTGGGDPTVAVMTVADAERYANGSVSVARPFEGGSRVSRPEPVDPFRLRSVRYVDWFTSVRDAAVVDTFERDGRSYVWLSLANDTYPGVRNSTGSALVDERGLVHSLRRSYAVPNRPDVRVIVTVEVVNVGETEAPPPDWYDDGTDDGAETAAEGRPPPPTRAAASAPTARSLVATNRTDGGAPASLAR